MATHLAFVEHRLFNPLGSAPRSLVLEGVHPERFRLSPGNIELGILGAALIKAGAVDLGLQSGIADIPGLCQDGQE